MTAAPVTSAWRPALAAAATAVLLAIASPVAAIERIALTTQLIHPATAENQKTLDLLLAQAASHLSSQYAAFVEGVAPDTPADAGSDFTAAFTAVFSDEPGQNAVTFVTTRASDGSQSDSGALLGPVSIRDAQRLAGQLFQQWASFYGYLESQMVEPPQLVAEIHVDALRPTLLPEVAFPLTPQGTAMHPSGDLLVGFGAVGARLDRAFRIVDRPGGTLVNEGNYTFASSVAVTPSGTIFYKPAAGRELYRIIDGAPRPQRWTTGQDAFGPISALGDGSVVITDVSNRRSQRVQGRKRYEFDLYTSEWSYITGLTVGPEGNLWAYDGTEKRLKIHSPDGTLIDEIVPIIDPTAPVSPSSLGIFGNGNFVIGANNLLLGFRRDGTPLWRLESFISPNGFEETVPLVFHLAVDPGTGIVYLVDVNGRRILKLVDWGTAAQLGAENQLERRLAELNSQEPAAAAVGKAAIYEESGALEMASVQWERVLEEDPFNRQADGEIARLQTEVELANAAKLTDQTMEILRTIGPESARQSFSRTVQVYERILSINPGHSGASKALQTLQERFASAAGAAAGKKPPITIRSLHLENLFPSLMQTYRYNPVGNIELLNELDSPVTDLTASLSLRRYTDFPTESETVARLEPGESATLDLKVILNDTVFGVQEHLPVQAQVAVRYG